MEDNVKRLKESKEDSGKISFLSSGGGLVFDADDILHLRSHRINGELVGTDFEKPNQNQTHGPPFALSQEEVPIACELLKVDLPESHKIDTLKARVYREVWSTGFWLAKGTSFGADYLVYSGDPNVYHASMLLVIKPWEEARSVLSYSTVARLGTTVKKVPLIASQKPDGSIWLYTIKWVGT